MYDLEFTKQFKKDLRLMARRGLDISEAMAVIDAIKKCGQAPAENLPYMLRGEYKGVWECHIRPDWLLIYDRAVTIKLVRLIRSGTHADLFKK